VLAGEEPNAPRELVGVGGERFGDFPEVSGALGIRQCRPARERPMRRLARAIHVLARGHGRAPHQLVGSCGIAQVVAAFARRGRPLAADDQVRNDDFGRVAAHRSTFSFFWYLAASR
jgi:hypothetical protein